MLLASFVVIAQQLSGITVVTTNLTDILSSSGLDLNPNFQAGIGSCAQFVSVIIGSIFVDKFGIKKMWCISFGFLAVSFILYAIHEKLNLGNWVPLFAIFLYQLTYGFGGGPIPWYVGPRYLPDSVRPQGSLINGCSMYSFCTLLTFVFPVMREKMQMFGLFVFYAALSLISCIIGGIFLYEPLSREELNKLDNEDELSEDDEANMQENNNKLENETI